MHDGIRDVVELLQRYRTLHFFPCKPNSKKPAVSDWERVASRDPYQLAKWVKTFPGCNWAIACGPSGVVSLDVDVKDRKPGLASYHALVSNNGRWSAGLLIRTTSGGFQEVFLNTKRRLGNSSNKIADGIDTRGAGGYLLCPGSIIDGSKYELRRDKPLTEPPTWLVEAAMRRAPAKPSCKSTAKVELDTPAALDAARRILASDPGAVEGQGGDHHTYQLAAKLKDWGISQAMALELMLELWNEKCAPPWDADELEVKVRNAYEYGENAVGSRRIEAEAIFDDLPEEDRSELPEMDDARGPAFDEASMVDFFNKRFSVIRLGHKVRISEESMEKGQKVVRFLSREDFLLAVADRRVAVEDGFKKDGTPKIKFVNAGKLWLEHPGRRVTWGVDFAPPGATCAKGYINTYSGLSMAPTRPDREKFSLYAYLVEQIIAGGNSRLAAYIWDWLADLFQRPGVGKPGVALVLHGERGTGKGTFCYWPLRMLGALGIQLNNQHHLSSNFNGHLAGKLLVVADEAFWSKDHSVNGVLKGLITEQNQTVEHKGLNPMPLRSFCRVIINTNEISGARFGERERRFFPLELSSEKCQDTDFFGELNAQMENGGARALLGWLLARDLSKVNLRNFPKTKKYAEQIHCGMAEMDHWWFECLKEGRISSDEFFEDENSGWPEILFAKELLASWQHYAKQRRLNFVERANELIRHLRKRNPAIFSRVVRPRVEGGGQRHGYFTGALQDARRAFEDSMGTKFNWEDDYE